MINALVYCEFGNLLVRKPNGLEYRFDNVDKPDLGFDFDVLVYDQIEVKILEWDKEKPFDEQDTQPLTETDRDAIERYIENSEPPHGITLNNQYIDRVHNAVKRNIEVQCEAYGFENFLDAIYAGREGSAHPYRSEARRVLEFADATYTVADGIYRDISVTREDTLSDLEEYIITLPPSSVIQDG